MDDFELDPETLKQIEEEARQQFDAEFELDEETLKQIEQEALREAGLLDDDLGEMTLAGITAETVKEVKEEAKTKPPVPPSTPKDDAKPAGKETRREGAGAIPPPPAPPPRAEPQPEATPAVPAADLAAAAAAAAISTDTKPAPADAAPAADADAKKPRPKKPADPAATSAKVKEAKKAEYEKKREEAITKVKKKVAEKAKVAAGKRKHAMPAVSPALAAIENEPRSNNAIILVFVGSLAFVVLAIVGMIFYVRSSKGADGGGNGVEQVDPVAAKRAAGEAAFQKLNDDWKTVTKPPISKEKLEAAIANIQKFRDEFPDTAGNETIANVLSRKEKQFQEHLKLYSEGGGDTEAGGGEVAPAP